MHGSVGEPSGPARGEYAPELFVLLRHGQHASADERGLAGGEDAKGGHRAASASLCLRAIASHQALC